MEWKKGPDRADLATDGATTEPQIVTSLDRHKHRPYNFLLALTGRREVAEAPLQQTSFEEATGRLPQDRRRRGSGKAAIGAAIASIILIGVTVNTHLPAVLA